MKRWMKISICICVVLVLGVAGTLFYLNRAVTTMAKQMYEPLALDDRSPLTLNIAGIDKASEDALKPFTVLLLGVDERGKDIGRSDTTMLIAVNPAKESILTFNIPRDTRTTIIGRGTEDKINHAYAFGGTSMSVRTVENFLNYPIDYYVKVNMEGLVHLIDSVGGIEVENHLPFSYEGYSFEKGTLKLDGKKALSYSRMRFDDPRGDLGRNERQREIIKALIQQSMTWKGLTKLQAFMDELGQSVKTNMQFDMMREIFLSYRPKIKEVSSIEIEGKGQKLNNIYYYIVDEPTRTSIHNKLVSFMSVAGRS
ncbi:LCP family protein [Paenibacillus sp. GCM10012307]|uniref:LCP family protein n=1 Tax=Paenibacillus roseus TaxID=2798579 RepID=A0A934MMS6_9BACL|nr:LCP family protein [Paenibacillus roseus]MBJ6360251.1 LCP family protein [Paenibacillus roseus]